MRRVKKICVVESAGNHGGSWCRREKKFKCEGNEKSEVVVLI
jgi:hypothetical protein